MHSPNYLPACFAALIVPVLLIPLLFYAYTAATGSSILAADITIYFISVAAAFFLAFVLLRANPLPKFASVIAAAGIAVLILCFASFTLFPPRIFLFRDPLTGQFGL